MDKYWSSKLFDAREGGAKVCATNTNVSLVRNGENTCRPLILASESAATECRGDIKDDPALPYDAVVVAFAPTRFDYATLNTAFRVLMHEHDTQRGRPQSD